jgi:AcrR family transcriptional regulator
MADGPTPRERVLAAAFDEFAERGIAGARIDRIATAAKTSKERVYAYFRSKNELYAAIIGEQISVVLDSVTLDVRDIPGYVGELFDFFVEHPGLLRLLNWGRLEALGSATPEGDEMLAAKIRTVAEAQADGLIADDVPALDVLLLITQLATAYLASNEFHGLADPSDASVLAQRRAAAMRIATRLFPPAT